MYLCVFHVWQTLLLGFNLVLYVHVCVSFFSVHAWAVSWELFTVVSHPYWPHSETVACLGVFNPNRLKGSIKTLSDRNRCVILSPVKTLLRIRAENFWNKITLYMLKNVANVYILCHYSFFLIQHICMPWYFLIWNSVHLNLHVHIY